MTRKQKEREIDKLVRVMLNKSVKEIRRSLIKKALKSNAIDIDGWDINDMPMILPKIILIACLESEANQYKATGTAFEKKVKYEVNNLKLFL